MEEKKRYNLGVLIGGVHTYFPKEHIKGISEAAAELDVNVCFFLGTRTKDFFEDVLGSKQKNSYDYQFNTIHDYSLIERLLRSLSQLTTQTDRLYSTRDFYYHLDLLSKNVLRKQTR